MLECTNCGGVSHTDRYRCFNCGSSMKFVTPEYSQGVADDGIAILENGVAMQPELIIFKLNNLTDCIVAMLDGEDLKTLDLSGSNFWVNRASRAERKIEQLKASNTVLLDALEGIMGIVNDSSGVTGYHLNGKVALWEEFIDIENAIDAIKLARGEG